MGDSFDGITVPPGHPDAVRAAGARLQGICASLGGLSDQLRGMPTGMSSWQGPASVSYAGSCMTASGMAVLGVDALGTAAQLTRTYSDDLETAQRETRAAIAQAREATRRIKAAEAAISAAQTAQADAAVRATTAEHALSISSSAGVPSPIAQADLTQAQSDAANAAGEQARAQRQLAAAQHDLRTAIKRGQDAEHALQVSAHAVAGAMGAVAGSAPVAIPVMGPASGTGSAGGDPAWLPAFDLAHKALDAGVITSERGSLYLSDIAKISVAAYTRAGGWVNGYFRTAADGSKLWVNGYWRRGGQVSGYVRETQDSLKWKAVSDGAKKLGLVFSVGAAGIDQWAQDSSNPNLTTTDRVGRTAGAAAYVGGVSWAGAEAGAPAGAAAGAAAGSIVPILGNGVGGVVGGIIGGVAGGVSAGWVADKTKGLAVDIGQGAANLAVGGEHLVSKALDAINPFG